MARNHREPLPTTLPFQMDPEPADEVLTSFAGLCVVAQGLRSLGVLKSVDSHLVLKKRERGFTEAEMVESLILMQAAGGECPEDLERLRQDPGLPTMLGHEIPAAETGLKFLRRFHDEEVVRQAEQGRPQGQICFIPQQSTPLAGLAQVNTDLVRAISAVGPVQSIATVDADATVIESRNKNAKMSYLGELGYQPQVAVWAETELVLADEFRDGNVPAQMQPLEVAQRAFNALPSTVTTRYYRGDSASYEWRLLNWLRDPERQNGPQGPIGFAVSARMSEPMRAAIAALDAEQWRPYQAPGQKVDPSRELAELPYVPDEPTESKNQQPLRYIAIRVWPKQGELFADGSAVKHFVVASNLWDWEAAKLVQWHRQKAGTIEKVHDEVKNELGGGLMPSGDFGANAAWFRLSLLTHNVLVGLKRIALPPELLEARPKRLRYQLLGQAGRLVQHARRTVLKVGTKLAATVQYIAQALAVLRALPAPA